MPWRDWITPPIVVPLLLVIVIVVYGLARSAGV